MTTVWITEKPSAAKDLAAGLCLAYGIKSTFGDGCIQLSNGDVIVPLAGHVLETARPGEYLSEKDAEIERQYKYDEYKSFLPILPTGLKKHPRREASAASGKAKKGAKPGARSAPGMIIKPYKTAQSLIKKATTIVNAGDIDREGQLIVDELLEHFGVNPYGPNVKRFGIASNLPQDIAAAVKAGLDSNGSPKWRLATEAAATRQYLDWTWGINLSMVGQAIKRNARISAGRVQTPVLALVDERCREIENFKPVDYFVPIIILADGTTMRWRARPGSEGQPGFDRQGRIVSEALALAIVDRIKKGLPGKITKADVTTHSQKPPLGYSLSALQSAASKEIGITLEQVGEAAKNLYQTHKAISYIGTDCKYLPESMHAQAPKLLLALAEVSQKAAMGADAALKSPIFNDAKLDEHYAIIPTGVIPKGATEVERGVYQMVVRRFIGQFYPDYVFRRHNLEAQFGEDQFAASDRQDMRMGWREVDGQSVPMPQDEGGEDRQQESDRSQNRAQERPRN